MARKVYPLVGNCVQNRSMVCNKKIGPAVVMAVAMLFAAHSAPAVAQQSSQNANSGSSPQNPPAQSGKQQSGQSQSQPGKGQSSSKTTSAPAKSNNSSSSDSNPFPMEQSQAAAKSNSQRAAQQGGTTSNTGTGESSGSNSNPANAGSNNGKSSQQSPAKDNPFPEEQSAAAAKQTSDSQNGAQSAQPGSASSSSSSGSYSSSDAHLPEQDLGQGKGNVMRHPKLDSYTRDQTQDGRIKDDLNVADFYMKNGNYKGAYLRYDDALQADPENDTALYGLADSMCKQNMTEDAMARFKSYAKTHPQGKYALKAEKMLAHPQKCMHNW